MIKAENGKATIDGTGLDIITDYMGLTRCIVDCLRREGLPDNLIDDLLKLVIEVGQLSKDELEMKSRELTVLMMMKLFK